MPLVAGQWYQVVFNPALNKWSPGPSQPYMHGMVVQAIVEGTPLVVRGRGNNMAHWRFGEIGPFSDDNFSSMIPLPSVTMEVADISADLSFCKDKHGDVHMWNSETGKIFIIKKDDAVKLKSFL